MLIRIYALFKCFRIGSFSIATIKETTLQLKKKISIGSWKKNYLRRPHFIAVFGLPVSQREERLREKERKLCHYLCESLQ
jgi:hypothetical protein